MPDRLPPLIPREVLFGNPERMQPRVSPDGTRLAYIAPDDGVLNVFVRTIGETDDRPVTKDRDRGIRGYFWAKDNRHILYVQDKGGDENWRLYSVDLVSGDIRDLTPFEDVQVQPVKQSKHHPDVVLVAMNKDNPQLHDIYRLTLSSGRLDLVARNPGSVMAWVPDFDLRVRAAQAATPDGGFDVLYRDQESDEWRTIVHWDLEDAMVSGAVGFTRDGERLYLQDSRGANTGRLIKLGIATGDVEVIASDDRYDVTNALIHPDTTEVQAVAFLRSRLEWEVLDESVRADFEGIAQIDRGDFSVYDRDDADETWLVGFTADNGPVAYYAWDRKAREATFLFHHRPDLAEYTLAEMEPFSFEARDGLKIEAYATFPPGGGRSKLPTVLVVHGGPWARDVWGLDPEAQWLANRGYLCVQANYRGSSGYGKAHLNAGDKEWGGKMHDDLVDAVRHVTDRGWADPDRVAIYGGSYGGWAANCGATFTPELFRCAVSIVGPSNLITFINSIPPYWMPMLEMFKRRVGDPETEEEFLKSRSPLFHVDRIRVPMLIAHGANDPRVKQAESEQLVAALSEKGLDHEYLLFPDEGHGFAKPENRLSFYAAAEAFLARHLGGRTEH